MDLTGAWRVVDAQGVDRTARLSDYFKGLTVLDRPGRHSDEARLMLADTPHIELPSLSKALTFHMGEDSSSLVDLGQHYVTDYELTAPGEALTVVTRPIYFGGGGDPQSIEAPARVEEVRSIVYQPQTFGDIAQRAANRMSVELAIDADFASFIFESVVQDKESDPAFISRLARLAGGIAKLMPGVLVIGTPHTAQSYGRGEPMPTVQLETEDVSGYRFSWSARKDPATVRAYWFDSSTGLRGFREFGFDPPVTALRKTFGSFDAAERAAKSHWQLLRRRMRSSPLTLDQLNLSLWVGSSVELGDSWHPEVRGQWEVVEASHTLAPSGGTTTIEIERNTDG